MHEFELIGRYFCWTSPSGPRNDVIVGVGDDGAVLSMPAGRDLVAAVDTVLEGRHFPHGSPARSVGHRALAVNLSDMAAMGAVPAWATLALTIPRADGAWLEAFAAGLRNLAELHSVALVGGDTTAGPLSVTLQILGHVPTGQVLRRGGGRTGDLLAVTGTLGDAGGGLALVSSASGSAGERTECAEQLISRFEYPTPRVELGRAALGIANAAMDISDGLTGDLPKLAAASGLAAHVAVETLPLSDALRALFPLERARGMALSAGDDYELLLAVAPHRYAELETVARRIDLKLTVIGELRPGNGVHFALEGAFFDAPSHGFDHFR